MRMLLSTISPPPHPPTPFIIPSKTPYTYADDTSREENRNQGKIRILIRDSLFVYAIAEINVLFPVRF